VKPSGTGPRRRRRHRRDRLQSHEQPARRPDRRLGPRFPHADPLVQSAVAIGIDLGPNLSVTGSPATILWLPALRQQGENVSGWSFLKTGAWAMPIARRAPGRPLAANTRALGRPHEGADRLRASGLYRFASGRRPAKMVARSGFRDQSEPKEIP
jgi:hypothetical protein